jgi:hypothetical protein
MDTLTAARAVLAPKRRVSSDTSMTDSLILERPKGLIIGPNSGADAIVPD